MAKRLRFADIDQGTTVDLLSGTLKMEDGTWQTRFTRDRAIETMNLVAFGETDSNIIAGRAAIDNVLREGREWHRDRILTASYWLEANATSETARRSLVYKGMLENVTRGLNNPLLGAAGGEAFFRLALTRHQLWESVSPTASTTTNISSMGGQWVLADNGGDTDGRLAQLDIDGRSGGGSLEKMWVGIRPAYYGTTDFQSLWECEDGTLGTDTSSTVVASASGGDVAECDFSTTTTLTDRVTLVVGNTSTPEHMIGRYHVLLRCYVDSGTNVGIQARTGFSGISTFAENKERLNFSSTNAKLVPLGHIQIPGQGYRSLTSGASNVKNFTLKIAAERISGSGSLYMDAIVLVPSKYFIRLDDASVSYPGTSWPTEVYTNEDDFVKSLSFSGSPVIPTAAPKLAKGRWGYPKNGGVLVFAGEGSTSQTVTDAVDLGYSMYPRWFHWHS